MCRCGPLTHISCIRFEGKHRYFKQIAKVTGNFKNIAKTVAFRHQRYMTYHLSQPHNYLKQGVEVGPGMSSKILNSNGSIDINGHSKK